MIVEDDVVIFFDKSIARIEPDGSVEFFPNYNKGWKKPCSKKNKPQIMSFIIGSKTKKDALDILSEMERLIMEEKL